MTMRNLARVSATGLLAAGVLALAATPALAADVDFGLDVKGTSIALGASGKPAGVDITNHGTTTPDLVRVLFDITDIDTDRVELDLGDCTFDEGIADCELNKDLIPGPGQTAKTDVPLVLKEGEADDGPLRLGELEVTVVVEGDSNEANDTKRVDVDLVGGGGDLRVRALDVSKVDAENQLTGQPLQPGEASFAYAYVFNHGDRATQGIKLDIKLPEQVTFAEEEETCEYNAAKTEATCTSEDYVLQPWDADESENKENSSGTIAFKVQVSEDAKGPATLAGGTWTVAALGLVEETARKARTATVVPDFVKPGCGDKEDEVEVDESDNSDSFVALLAGPTGGSGAGGDDEGPTLPITGPVAASVAGAGAAVLAAGVVLLMASRRRKVVLVTPGDEK